MNHFIRISMAITLFVGCSSIEPIVSCESKGDIRAICGLLNPEDIAVVPGSQYLLISQMGLLKNGQGSSGNIALFNVSTEKVTSLFPQAGIGTKPQISEGPNWGDKNCPGPPIKGFIPHGIDLSPRTDGKQQLLVVNHGGRESIEFFELIQEQEGYTLHWRGCAIPPEKSFLNDVVALPKGGFLTTHMFPRSIGLTALYYNLSASLGINTGHLLEWQLGKGFWKLPNTQGPYPNGVEVSKDGKDIYLNVYQANQIWRISRRSGKRLGEIDIPHPDNSSWDDDGNLLVASHVAKTLEIGKCLSIEKGACPIGFEIVSITPDLSEKKRIFHNQGPPMGAGTVAVSVGKELFIGSFAADRMLRVKR